MMIIAFWLMLSVFMFISIDVFSFGIKRAGWGRFICTFLLYYSQIILSEFSLGLISNLTSINLAILNILISILINFLIYKKFGLGIYKKYISNIYRICVNTWHNIKEDRIWKALLIVAAVLLAWIIFLGVIFPATDFDGNSYHLTFIGYAIQNHNFFDVPTSLGWLTGYPKGGEFIEMWNVMIPHNDMFVDLVQVPFLALGVYALYDISRRLGVDAKSARFTSILFLFLPIVLNQLKTTYIDVMLCSLFFAAIALVVKKKLGKIDLLLIGIVMSLIISIKASGLLFIAALAPLLLWNLFNNRDKKSKSLLKSYGQPLSIVFLPTLFGFYWYVKDFILYNNPLYPFGLKIMGLTIFPGRTFQDLAADAVSTLKDLPTGCVDRLWFVWTEQKDWFGCLYNYDANYTGLGPIWFIVLIPAFIISLYFIIKHKNYLYAIITAAILAVFAVYPINYYSRYTMFITAIGIFSLGIVFTNINSRVSDIIKKVLVVLAISVIATNFALCNFPPKIVGSQLRSLAAGNVRGIAYENTIGKSYTFIQDKLKAKEVIAYDSSPYFIYPLWRFDFSNVVTYIPANTKDVWYKKVKSEKVKYVFTQIGSKEYEWIKNDTAVTSIYKDLQYEIFQVY